MQKSILAGRKIGGNDDPSSRQVIARNAGSPVTGNL